MSTKLENFIKTQTKTDLPDIRPGDTVRVYQKIPAFAEATAGKPAKAKTGKKEEDKEKIQVFEGIVLARKHGKEIGATITVRKIISGIGVERIFPLHSPALEKIEIIKKGKVRRAKLYYLRKVRGKRAKLKKRKLVQIATEGKTKEVEAQVA